MQERGRGVGQNVVLQKKGWGEGVGETIGSYQRSGFVGLILVGKVVNFEAS